MNHWHDYPVPAMRHEALHGDRLVRCFAGRPAGLYAMFAASVARSPDADALVCDGRRWSYAQCDARRRSPGRRPGPRTAYGAATGW